MALGTNIRTYFNGQWHEGDQLVMRAADHAMWHATSVYDGIRLFQGVVPDLDAHCARLNRSARAMMMEPTVADADMAEIIREGIAPFGADRAVYIRPMYWCTKGGDAFIPPDPTQVEFAISLEELPMAPANASQTMGRTQFHRPLLGDTICDAKAGALYPNIGRMLLDVRSRGFLNALVADAMGNVADAAAANVFMVRDGEVFTPIPNGTFLAGITRARHIKHMRDAGIKLHETVLSFDDFEQADEVFLSANMNKITPVTAFEDTTYQVGPIYHQLREMYFDWALSER